ncbi:hypothetical protein [Escherichia coli]|uniref:hypothetical protein n=1 Tax=Escherichia coli TaxID=562 RepID=UPI0038B27D6A
MFYDPADRDDLVDPDALRRWRTHSLVRWTSIRVACSTRRAGLSSASAAWNADGEEEQRDLAIAAAIKQVRQTSY